MKLKRKHIGRLFNTKGADGTWVYQLVDIKDGWLLFYNFERGFWKERYGEYKDWQEFEPVKKWPKEWKQKGWDNATDIERGMFI